MESSTCWMHSAWEAGRVLLCQEESWRGLVIRAVQGSSCDTIERLGSARQSTVLKGGGISFQTAVAIISHSLRSDKFSVRFCSVLFCVVMSPSIKYFYAISSRYTYSIFKMNDVLHNSISLCLVLKSLKTYNECSARVDGGFCS